jgi:hypothetical protein
LRATFLFALWCTHLTQEGEGPTGSAGVVQRAVAELQRVMWAQFRVAAFQDDTTDALPTHLLTADLKPPPLQEFEAVWARGDVLCSVERQPGGGVLQLRMRLSLHHPVAAPGLPATLAGDDGQADTGAGNRG